MGLLSRFASAIGFRERTSSRIPRGASGRVIPDLSMWAQHQRIGGALTPHQVSTIIREADNGDMRRLMDLASEARSKDGHLQAILSQTEESIAGLNWQLQMPEGVTPEEQKNADWCEAYLRKCPNFSALIAHLTGAVYHGYAVAEIIWGRVDGYIVPVSFVMLAPRRFAFRLVDGAFIWRDEGSNFNGIDFMTEYPDKFVVSRPRVTGDVPCREGLVRVLMWAALFRNWTMSDWLRTGEIAWKPWRIGQYDSGAKKEDIDGLAAVMDGLTTNGVAVLPKSVEYEIMWPGNKTGNNSMHGELFGVVAQEMSKAALGQTDTVQSATSSSYAQANVHKGVRADLIESRARSIATDITRDIVERMIRINFGPGCTVPNFLFITQDPFDLASFADAIGKLVVAGCEIPQNWVRDQGGIPHPKEGDDLMGTVDIPIDPATGLPTEPSNDPTPAHTTAKPQPASAKPKAKPAKKAA